MARTLTLLITLCFLLSGCEQQNKQVALETSADAETQENNTNTADDEQDLYRMGDWDTVEEFVEANQGKVVVVDIWSTYCAPCMKEFPRLIELQEKYGEQIACVSFNINYAGLPDQTPETDLEFIEPFLKRHGNTVHHIVSTVTDEKIYAQLEFYAIPAVLIYDTTGTLTDKVLEENAYESTVFPRVAELLKKPEPTGESDEP